MENDVLRSGSKKSQVITGNWEIGTLKAESIQTGNKIGDVLINGNSIYPNSNSIGVLVLVLIDLVDFISWPNWIPDFLLTTCERSGYNEILQGNYIFNQDVDFAEGLALGSSATINNITFSNIALRSQKYSDIRGYKHADYVNGGEGLVVSYLNGVCCLVFFKNILYIPFYKLEQLFVLACWGFHFH